MKQNKMNTPAKNKPIWQQSKTNQVSHVRNLIAQLMSELPKDLRVSYKDIVVNLFGRTNNDPGVFEVKIKGISVRPESIFTSTAHFELAFDAKGKLQYTQFYDGSNVHMDLKTGIKAEFKALVLGDTVARREYKRVLDKQELKLVEKANAAKQKEKAEAKATKRTMKAIAKFNVGQTARQIVASDTAHPVQDRLPPA